MVCAMTVTKEREKEFAKELGLGDGKSAINASLLWDSASKGCRFAKGKYVAAPGMIHDGGVLCVVVLGGYERLRGQGLGRA